MYKNKSFTALVYNHIFLVLFYMSQPQVKQFPHICGNSRVLFFNWAYFIISYSSTSMVDVAIEVDGAIEDFRDN